MRIGSALDAILTGTERELAVRPDVDRRTKAGKALYEEFMAQLGNRTEVSQSEYQVALDMADAVLAHPTAHDLLTRVHSTQSSLFCTGGRLGWRCRLDAALTDGTVLEIKTHAPADTESDFAREWASRVAKWGYHRQAYLYRLMWALHTGRPLQEVNHVFLCVSNDEPYDVHVCHLTEEYLDIGRRELEHAAQEIANRMEFSDWELDNRPLTIGAPEWLRKKIVT